MRKEGLKVNFGKSMLPCSKSYGIDHYEHCIYGEK